MGVHVTPTVLFNVSLIRARLLCDADRWFMV